jgi:broad specificity phosphatase PhoE
MPPSTTAAAWVALSATVALAGLGYAAWESFRRLRSLERRLSERERRSRVHKPALIVLVRHGESEANVDPAKYCSVGDVHVRLTQKGREQAIAAAETLAELVGDRSVFSYVSPYKRTKETAGLLLDRLPKGQVVAVREDPRLREREFAGSFQRSDAAIDRSEENRFGKFFWRAPGGESPADVYDRVTAFLDTLWRDFRAHPELSDAVVVVAGHGLTNRLLAMRWLHWAPEVRTRLYAPLLPLTPPYGSCALTPARSELARG